MATSGPGQPVFARERSGWSGRARSDPFTSAGEDRYPFSRRLRRMLAPILSGPPWLHNWEPDRLRLGLASIDPVRGDGAEEPVEQRGHRRAAARDEELEVFGLIEPVREVDEVRE